MPAAAGWSRVLPRGCCATTTSWSRATTAAPISSARQKVFCLSGAPDCDPSIPFLSDLRTEPGRLPGHNRDSTMWAAFVRQFAAYAITRRGKKLFALIGVLALCFGAALLIDMRFYVSASFVTLLAGFSGVAYVIQHVKIKRLELQRLLLKAEAARQRAMVAQARLERIDNAKSALQGAMVGAVGFVTHNVNVVANEAVLAVVESAEAVERAYRTAAGMVETKARAGLVYAVRGLRSFKA